MKWNAGVAAAIVSLTLLTYFQFPGHTYLHQDTQIYVPILEHLWDSSVLTQDILVQRPHVAFTLYDELALALRWATGAGFESILTGLQLLTRGLGLLGVYLIGMFLLKNRAHALIVTAVCSWGAAIDGPAVLVTEYEPSPRAFAIPLVFLALGLIAWGRPVWAASVASIGFVLHPPSVLVFWTVLFWKERKWRVWIPFVIAILALLVGAAHQPGVKEAQPFFSRISPELERLQRLRASYNWVSLWWGREWWKHCSLFAVVCVAFWRLRKMGEFLVGLPALGLLSVPLSWLLLEKLKWGLVPQVQPTRTLLFTTAMAILLASVCGSISVSRNRWPEAFGWFFVASVPALVWGHWWLAAILALALICAVRFTWSSIPVLAGCFFLIPFAGRIVNYPVVRTPELQSLSDWARRETPKDAVFLFPEAGKSLDPGVFRSEALRAVYVDWKGGGQVNYLPELGYEWWQRWRGVMLVPVSFAKYRRLGIGYAVLAADHAWPNQPAAFRNSRYVVYLMPGETP